MDQIADEMKPGPILLGALEMICRIVPTWKIIPAKDMLDKVCKDPELREQVVERNFIKIFTTAGKLVYIIQFILLWRQPDPIESIRSHGQHATEDWSPASCGCLGY